MQILMTLYPKIGITHTTPHLFSLYSLSFVPPILQATVVGIEQDMASILQRNTQPLSQDSTFERRKHFQSQKQRGLLVGRGGPHTDRYVTHPPPGRTVDADTYHAMTISSTPSTDLTGHVL